MEAHLEKDMTFNSIHKREILEGSNIFGKFHTPPPPPLKVNWIPLSKQFLTSLVSHCRQQIDTPPTHPCQNKRHSSLRMKMRPNQDVRWDAKKCASGYAIATPLAYARVYPEPQSCGLSGMEWVGVHRLIITQPRLGSETHDSETVDMSSEFL